MAKFKVGDKVKIVGFEWKGAFEIEDDGRDGTYHLKGTEEWVDGDKLKAANSTASTNPVVQNALAAKGVARNARVPEVERRLKTILSVEIPKLNKLYDDARKLDKSIKNELDRLARDVGDISDSDANRLGTIVYGIRTASPFGSL